MRKTFIHLFLASCLCFVSASNATPIAVRAEGSGNSLESAKTAALIDAVRQVTGVAIDHQTMSHLVVQSSSNENGTTTNANERQQALFKEKAKGVINRFRVLNNARDEKTGEYSVVLLVEVEKYEVPTTTSNRKSITVQAFEASPGVCFRKPYNPDTLVTSLTDSAQSVLAGSRKFSVLDRHGAAYEKEKQFINSEDTKASEQAKLGHLESSDFILTGKIQNLQINENTRKLKLSNGSVSSRNARADFIFNIMMFANREIQFSSRVHIDLKEGLAGLTCKEIADKIAHAAAAEVGRQAILAIFPPKVIGVDEDELHFNYGDKEVHLGEVYKVYSEGKEIFDPYTKESLGKSEKYIGKAKVIDTKAKMSVAVMEKQGAGAMVKPGDILRPYVEPPKEAPKKSSKNRKSSHNDEW